MIQNLRLRFAMRPPCVLLGNKDYNKLLALQEIDLSLTFRGDCKYRLEIPPASPVPFKILKGEEKKSYLIISQPSRSGVSKSYSDAKNCIYFPVPSNRSYTIMQSYSTSNF